MNKIIPTLVFTSAVFAAGLTVPQGAFARHHDVPKAQPAVVHQAVSVNHADVKTLQKLPGIGKKRAQGIVAYRQAKGPFETLRDLLKVKGISQNLLSRLKSRLTV